MRKQGEQGKSADRHLQLVTAALNAGGRVFVAVRRNLRAGGGGVHAMQRAALRDGRK